MNNNLKGGSSELPHVYACGMIEVKDHHSRFFCCLKLHALTFNSLSSLPEHYLTKGTDYLKHQLLLWAHSSVAHM